MQITASDDARAFRLFKEYVPGSSEPELRATTGGGASSGGSYRSDIMQSQADLFDSRPDEAASLRAQAALLAQARRGSTAPFATPAFANHEEARVIASHEASVAALLSASPRGASRPATDLGR